MGFELTTLVVIDSDCTGSKSNYHTIATTPEMCFENLIGGKICLDSLSYSREGVNVSKDNWIFVCYYFK
jgi:hypothetical protein